MALERATQKGEGLQKNDCLVTQEAARRLIAAAAAAPSIFCECCLALRAPRRKGEKRERDEKMHFDCESECVVLQFIHAHNGGGGACAGR